MLDAYRAVVGSQDLGGAAVLSLALATTATLLAVRSVSGSRCSRCGRVTGRVVRAAAVATIPVPHVVGAASVGLLLADAGLLARLTGAAPGSFPQLVGGPWWIAMVAEYAWKESAFVALVAPAVLSLHEAELREGPRRSGPTVAAAAPGHPASGRALAGGHRRHLLRVRPRAPTRSRGCSDAPPRSRCPCWR